MAGYGARRGASSSGATIGCFLFPFFHVPCPNSRGMRAKASLHFCDKDLVGTLSASIQCASCTWL
jgi:hypothetical protein